LHTSAKKQLSPASRSKFQIFNETFCLLIELSNDLVVHSILAARKEHFGGRSSHEKRV